MPNQKAPWSRLFRNWLAMNALVAVAFISVHNAWAAAPDRTQRGERTALDRYVKTPDANYSYKIATNIVGDGYTAIYVDMISQAWLTTNEVNHALWQHWLTIVRPDKVTSSTALLFIGGGANNPRPPAKPDANLLRVAKETGTVVAELRNVPNQPVIFAGETQGRSEDSLIAYTWDKFLRTKDEKWPARLPMTK